MLSSFRARFLVDEGGVFSIGEGSSVREGVAIDFADIVFSCLDYSSVFN